MKSSKQLALYLVTDPIMCAQRGLVDTVLQAIEGGVTLVQLRDKYASDDELYHIACELKEAVDGRVPLLMNDHVQLAKKAGLDGAHIGQSDMSVTQARQILGDDAWLGLSVNTLAEAMALDSAKIDYLGLGPVFATATKQNHAPPIGIQGVAQLAKCSHLPNVAIGGIKAEHAPALKQTGIVGICAVSAICAASQPKQAAQALYQAFVNA